MWDNYLYIYRYGNDLKGDWASAAMSLVFVVPFAIVLWYVEVRLDFDTEDRIGWGLVPFAMLLALKMNTARHLLIVLLVPDKRGIRNVAAAIGLAFPFLFPSLVAFNSALLISTAVLCIGLVFYLDQIGWDVVRDDFRHPGRTARCWPVPTDARSIEDLQSNNILSIFNLPIVNGVHKDQLFAILMLPMNIRSSAELLVLPKSNIRASNWTPGGMPFSNSATLVCPTKTWSRSPFFLSLTVTRLIAALFENPGAPTHFVPLM